MFVLIKKEMRNDIMSKLKKFDAVEYQDKNTRIMERLIHHPAFQRATTIGITISRFPEVDTEKIIEFAWQQSKTIVVPKCNAKTRQMDFRRIDHFQQLETVYMDLKEPIVEQTESYSHETIDLLIVPGVVFNRAGYRIGFGGGYYDRFLSCYQNRTISLAFSEQIQENLPIESHDLPVQTIITDLDIIDCQKE